MAQKETGQEPFGSKFSEYHQLRNVCMESRQEWSTGEFPLERGEGRSVASVTCTMAFGAMIETEVSRKTQVRRLLLPCKGYLVLAARKHA